MRRFLVLWCGLLLCACGGYDQEPKMVLYDGRGSSNVLPSESYSDTLTTGEEGRRIPLLVRWSTGRDSTGCLRIADVKVERTGGSPDAKIGNVRHDAVECGMIWESDDTTRFETVLIALDYQTRKGLRTYEFSGSVAHIEGTGTMRLP